MPFFLHRPSAIGFIRLVLSLAVLSLVALGPTAAFAQTVAGGSLFVTTSGDVQATYLGNSASYDDYLYLASPTNTLGQIFFNHGDPVGTTKDLGYFTAGTELVFRLHVANTANDFYSGDPSRNPDNHAHALVTYGYTPTTTLVGFEDLKGGPYDYNDLSFTFTNVQQISPVPEASTTVSLGLLLTLGLGGLVVAVRRKRV